MFDNSDLYNMLKDAISTHPYDKKKLKSSMIFVHKMKSERLIEKHKNNIFLMVGRVTTKVINNYFYRVRRLNVLKDKVFSPNDMVGEAYAIFNTCVMRCDLDRTQDFVWFYQTSLTRSFDRLIKKNHQNPSNISEYDFSDSINQSKLDSETSSDADFVSYYIDKYCQNGIQKLIIKAKINGTKVDDFCTKYKLSKNEYYDQLRKIKMIFQFLKST